MAEDRQRDVEKKKQRKERESEKITNERVHQDVLLLYAMIGRVDQETLKNKRVTQALLTRQIGNNNIYFNIIFALWEHFVDLSFDVYVASCAAEILRALKGLIRPLSKVNLEFCADVDSK